jgi:hypothetical protein
MSAQFELILSKDGDVYILMIPALAAEEQINRPTSADKPGSPEWVQHFQPGSECGKFHRTQLSEIRFFCENFCGRSRSPAGFETSTGREGNPFSRIPCSIFCISIDAAS